MLLMNYENILYEAQNGVAYITLNRPHRKNALSPQLVAELKEAAHQVAADDTIAILVVRGAGDAWSAGVDLQALNDAIKGGQFEADQILIDGSDFINTLQTMPKVTIAQVNGHCYTGALEFMLAFDLIYCADEAKIGDTHTKWGIAPKWGMTQRLPLMVGVLKAREMSFTAQAIGGKQAEAIGLVNKSVPAAELEDYVQGIITQIKANSRQAIAAMKELYHLGSHTTLAEGLRIELAAQYTITDRQDFLKGFRDNK